MSFNPNNPGNTCLNIFGLPFDENNAQIIIIPVPWDTTVSYKTGTSEGPKAVFDASFQVDLYDPYLKGAWKKGIAMLPIENTLVAKNKLLSKKAKKIIDYISNGNNLNESAFITKLQNEVNKGCTEMVKHVCKLSKKYLDKNKFVAVLGGEHSVPLGLLQSLSEKYSDFGILQIDAHADLRDAYEGFIYSHASVMHHALKIKNISKLVQVGIRDYCNDEMECIIKSGKRVTAFFDRDIQYQRFNGATWDKICDNIISKLPEKVYISFDIDGLDPSLCPNTGTPVAGGLQYTEAIYLLEKLTAHHKQIIGFDLCEIAPDDKEWDANVGARILFKLANCLAKSNNIKNCC